MVIDEIPELSHENAAQPDSLRTEREESHEWLYVDKANRLFAENFQSSPNCLFEIFCGESCREQGCIYFYSKDHHLCPLAIFGVILWEIQQVRQPDVGIGFAF